MFDKDKHWSGRHGSRMRELSAKYINRNVDVYELAPMVGLLYGRTAELDKTTSANGFAEEKAGQVMAGQMVNHRAELMFSYRLVMLLDEEYEPDLKKRIDKAFKHPGEDPDDIERFEALVRGGIDVLYEKLIEGDTPGMGETETGRILDFVAEYGSSFYNENTTVDRIHELSGDV